MSAALVEKIRRAREERVEVGGFGFTVRRPTDLEMMELRGGSIARLLPYVVGWDGVKEVDLLPGGDPHPLPFAAAACAEWLADRPDLLEPLVDRIVALYARHSSALAETRKK